MLHLSLLARSGRRSQNPVLSSTCLRTLVGLQQWWIILSLPSDGIIWMTNCGHKPPSIILPCWKSFLQKCACGIRAEVQVMDRYKFHHTQINLAICTRTLGCVPVPLTCWLTISKLLHKNDSGSIQARRGKYSFGPRPFSSCLCARNE